MEFGSSHVFLVKSGGPAIPSDLDVVASGPRLQQEPAQVRGTNDAEATLKKDVASVIDPLSSGAAASYPLLSSGDIAFTVKNISDFTENVLDWDGLGLQLGVKHSRLKKIRRENKTEDEGRRDMIFTWMNSDPEASWKKLSDALAKVDHGVLSNRITNKVLPHLEEAPILVPGMKEGSQFSSKMYTVNNEAYRSVSVHRCPPAPLGRVECDYPEPKPANCMRLHSSGNITNTNIIAIKFGVLSKPCKVHTGDPVICSNDQCAAILNHLSKIDSEEGGDRKVWVCEFCNTQNIIEIESGEVPQQGEILYLQECRLSTKDKSLVSGITKDSIVVFCVDTSGSMGVTIEVPGFMKLKGYEKLQKLNELYIGSGMQYMPGQSRNVTYISRLQCVQAAIDHQLNMLAQNNPSQRVAIVTFGNEVTVIGDGKPENEYIIVGDKLWKENALLKLSEIMPTPSPIRQTKELLSEKIFSIEEEGQTALGGALLMSIQLAKRTPGSKVILCTDGLANRGIGNLDDREYAKSSIALYKKLGTIAKESSVSVSVLTIKGMECDLLHLSEVARLSGGMVDVVDPMSIKEEFVNILSTSVVAVHANAKVILHPSLCFKDGDGKSTLSVPVGNVVDTTELLYEFTSSKKYDSEKELQSLPFQVQIKYTSLDGQQCLRVFTETKPVTSDRRIVNQGLNNDVLNYHRYPLTSDYMILRDSLGVGCDILQATYYESARYVQRREGRGTASSHCYSSSAMRMSPLSVKVTCMSPEGHDQCRSRLKRSRSCGSIDKLSDEQSVGALKRMRSQPEGSGAVSSEDCDQYRSKLKRSHSYGSIEQLGGEQVVHIPPPKRVRRRRRNPISGAKLPLIGPVCASQPNASASYTTSYADLSADIMMTQRHSCGAVSSEDHPMLLSGKDELKPTFQHRSTPIENSMWTGQLSDEEVAAAFKMRTERILEPTVNLKVQNLIHLRNEGYGFGFLVVPSKDEGTAVQSLIPDGIAWKDGRLQQGDRILSINGESVEAMPHQEVVEKLRLLNEEANSIMLCILREEPSSIHQKHESVLPVISLESEGSGSFGLTFKSGVDCKNIFINNIYPDGIAAKDGRLRANDKVLMINEEVIDNKTYNDILMIVKDIEDHKCSLELLVSREYPTSGGDVKMKSTTDLQTISLHNEGYGFGFMVQETKEKSVTVCKILQEGVAFKDDHLMINDKLVEINEKNVSDMTYEEVITLLRELNEDDHSTIHLKVESHLKQLNH